MSRPTLPGLRMLAAVGALLAALGGRPAAALPSFPLSTCFWEGPISTKQLSASGFDGRWFNYPEESATYWLARFRLPAGARLVLDGQFVRARYESFNAYVGGAPTDGLTDVEIDPDAGAINPFRAGMPRNRRARGFTVTVLPEATPAAGAPRPANTLYVGAPGTAAQEMVLRVYSPDRGRDLTGGVGLPEPTVVFADGTTATGPAACAAVNDADRTIPTQPTPVALWMTGVNYPGGNPATMPAFDPPHWERFFNRPYASTVFLEAAGLPRPTDPGADGGGLYSNRDTRYVLTHLSRQFGPVLIVQGRMPLFPRTERGHRPLGGEQVRFWSLCSGESSATLFTPDCLADHDVPLDRDRNFTIVVSRAADRPANATRRCGVAWLDWGNGGDGVGRPDYGMLLMRNMVASPDFAQATQQVTQPGQEAAVMGPYLPRSRYTTTAGFEAFGCRIPQLPTP